MTDETLRLAANTIRTLSMDAVQRANSGHPGMPMGMADLAAVVWGEFIVVDPDAPEWPDRDRFVLSNGHGSMLLYSLLHLSGFGLTMADLQNFRQWGSITAGHPERERHVGIEMTTGPLGQGFGTGVGMALAEAHLRARLGSDLVDHRTWGFVSDGDLMEGISYESASLAGHLGLGKLTYLYDDNEISIDGSTDVTFTEDVAARFVSQGWHTVDIDGHDHQAIREACREAIAETEKPTLVVAHTHIGYGSPNKQDTSSVHGSPLGDDEIRLTKEALDWPADSSFLVPPSVTEFFGTAMNRGREAHAAWKTRKQAAGPEKLALWGALWDGGRVSLDMPEFESGSKLATRAVNGKIFDQMAEKAPGLIGGAADLVGSTMTHISTSPDFSVDDPAGRNINFGIREHAMTAIVNGMAVHGGLKAYGSTFFVFTDYMRPALRLGALMEAPSIWVLTHDSVFLGEDGPTHQPIEHLASLRAMPGVWVVRPADAVETVEAWELALNRSEGPTALVLTRQGVPVLDRSGSRGALAQGGYVVKDGDGVVLVATGSEVSLAVEAANLLDGQGVSARVVSLPCWEAFYEQSAEYREGVLGAGLPRVSIEAAATFGWDRVVGADGLKIGIDRFGASAPAGILAEEFGFTAEAVASRVAAWLA